MSSNLNSGVHYAYMRGGIAWVKADTVVCCLQITLCDPYLSTLEAFVKTRYTNRRYLYSFTLRIIRRKPALTHASIVCDMLASVNSVKSIGMSANNDQTLLRSISRTINLLVSEYPIDKLPVYGSSRLPNHSFTVQYSSV